MTLAFLFYLLSGVSFFLYGVFYVVVLVAAHGVLSKIRYALSLTGLIVMLIVIDGILAGRDALETLAVVGALIVCAGFVTYLAILFRAGPVAVRSLLRPAAGHQFEMPART